MEKLLKADPSPGRAEIVADDLVVRKAGDNPHLWRDPGTMAAVAQDLAEIDPARRAEFQRNATAFDVAPRPLDAKIAAMRAKHAGQPVTASEPAFGSMATLIGLDMPDEAFQLSVMNDTEPSASDLARFEDDLRGHKVRAMIDNSQADDQAVKRLVPVVGVTETELAGTTCQDWMLRQLDALGHALSGTSS